MQPNAQTLPVMFRADRLSGDVTAVFPTVCADHTGQMMQCYAHIGQHSACSRDWIRRDTRPATPGESADLLAELTAIYTTRPKARPDIYGEPLKLEPCQRITPAHRREFMADYYRALAAVRRDPAGAPWSPEQRAAALG